MQAEALKRMGRGPDTQLIHMTDSEIDALNGLSGLVFNEPLRTNPETGLPEAGLFKKLLPTVLAIGAATFLGPMAGSAIGSSAIGHGLTAAGGHLAGQALSGQDVSLLRALPAAIGAGFTAPELGSLTGAGSAPVAADFEAAMAGAPGSFNPATTVPAPALSAGDIGSFAPVAVDPASGPMAALDVTRTPLSGTDLIRSPQEAFDFLSEDTLKRVGAPLGLAALGGEFDERPAVGGPQGDTREPFVPKNLRADRTRRNLDLDEDGEITQEDILQVVQGLPEGQSSRFFTPTVFTEIDEETETIKTGGLVGLQTGGEVAEAVTALTGGEGASILPMIAQAVTKPEEEEKQAVTAGHPLGTLGTLGAVPTSGISVGGGQPAQPFEEGGKLTNPALQPNTFSGSVLSAVLQNAFKEPEMQSKLASSPQNVQQLLNQSFGVPLPQPISAPSSGGGGGGGGYSFNTSYSQPFFEGRVEGPGDGMTDNIPFVIAGMQEGGQIGMQPAVLSPDEYVIPADVVSMLGNGSSSAGANELDAFIGNFRMDKYGRPEQPPEMRGGLDSLI